MHVKRLLGLCNIIFLTMIISSCGCSKDEEENESPYVEDEDEVEVVEEERSYLYSYPLTGEGTNDTIEGRAIAVVVNNHPKARPQSGLHKADIVYEVMAEGKMTRFLAIFHSEQPERVGPVRSARNYFIELAKGYDSFFIAHGYSPDAFEMLQNGYIDELNGMSYDGTLFKRASSRRAPHNSYISYDNIIKGGQQKNYDLSTLPLSNEFLHEDDVDNISGENVSSVSIKYSTPLFNVRYNYDDKLEKFNRYSNDEQTIDYDSDEPVLLDNIFIVETEHRVVDYEGRLAIDLTSGGKGYLLRKGKLTEVEWVNKYGKIIPVLNGVEVPFLQGKTWINIIDKSPGLENGVTIQ